MKIGLQLFSVRDEIARDLPGTLQRAARMGYGGVELFGPQERGAAEIRRLLDAAGLDAVGSHVLLPDLEGGRLERTLDFQAELGARHLTLAVLPEGRRETRAHWMEAARILNAAAGKAAARGLRLAYHNHRMEFAPLDGDLAFDILFRALSPEVGMQLDLGHALRGGGDPAALLRRYPGRARTVHVRDWSAKDDRVLVGEGDVPWAEVLPLCAGTGNTEWLIVEQGEARCAPLEAAERSLAALKRLLAAAGL
jgi:sugar phosphate isomerase/epimerase